MHNDDINPISIPVNRSSSVVVLAVVLSFVFDLQFHFASYVFFEKICLLVSIVTGTLGANNMNIQVRESVKFIPGSRDDNTNIQFIHKLNLAQR